MSPRIPEGVRPAVLGIFLVLGAFVTAAWGQADVQGQWSTLPYLSPTNIVHAQLLYNGKVLLIAGSKSTSGTPSMEAALWDPQAGTVTTQSTSWYMFCNGMTALADGRVFVNGGTIQNNPFLGSRKSAIYDPATNAFTDVQDMAHGRWYPTVTMLNDGRIMTFSGLNETTGATNNRGGDLYRGRGMEHAVHLLRGRPRSIPGCTSCPTGMSSTPGPPPRPVCSIRPTRVGPRWQRRIWGAHGPTDPRCCCH